MALKALFFAAAVSLASVQAPSPTAARIEGVAWDASTDRPLASVQVQIAGLRRSTNAEGRFVLDGLPSGTQTLVATKDNYMVGVLEKHRASVSGVPIKLAAGQQVSNVVVYLYPAGVVTGQVLDREGKGVSGVEVVPMRYTYGPSGKLELQSTIVPRVLTSASDASSALLARVVLPVNEGRVRNGRTNDRGEFRVSNLDPGFYAFYVRDVYGSTNLVFYPARRVEVIGGTETRIGAIVMPDSKQATLKVNVLDNPLANPRATAFRVRLKDSPETQQFLPDGAALLPPGHYELEAISVDEGTQVAFATAKAEFDVASDDIKLDMKLSPGTAVSGRAAPGVKIVFESAEALSGFAITMTSGADGVMSARSLPAGLYRVRSIEGVPQGMCVNALNEGLQVGAMPVSFEVLVTDKNRVLRGTASGKGAVVVLIPDDRTQTHLFKTAYSDQNGGFELSCVQPGSYQLYAWRSLDGAAYRNAEFMQNFDKRGVAVRVDDADLQTIAVEVFD
jgi:hypothetical protein